MSSLHSQAGKDKEALVEDYQKALKHIFAYDYECCAFKHSICSDRQRILDGMSDSVNPLPLKFFVNPRCPPALIAIEVKATEVDLGKAAKDPRRMSLQRNRADFFPYVSFCNYGRFLQGTPFFHWYAYYFL